MGEFILSNKPYIIKETNDLYFIYKPDGYTSDNSFNIIQDKNAKSIINYVRNNLEINDNLKNAKYKFGQINRLDYGTNGTIIIAKTIDVYEKLVQKLQSKKIKKIYIALVEGKIEKTNDFIMINLIKKQKEKENFFVEYSDKFGEPTLSEYYTWKTLYDENNKKYYTLLFIRIYTGITHQIRVHMKYIGHSLINDYNYGNMNKEINNGKIFLLSYLYCINNYGCSIDYNKEPNIKFDNLKEETINDYHKIMNFLLKKNDIRKNKMKELNKIIKKKNKNLNYYKNKKEEYTIVNIPAGKLNTVEKDILTKIQCLTIDKLHTITIIDNTDNIKNKKINHIYYFLVRNNISELKNNTFHIIPYQNIKIKDKNDKIHIFTQIFIKLFVNISSFLELEKELNDNNIYLIYDKIHGKQEIEYDTFKHYHNYVFPILENKILSKGFIKNIKKNKYKYDENMKFTIINHISKIKKNFK